VATTQDAFQGDRDVYLCGGCLQAVQAQQPKVEQKVVEPKAGKR
jgi:hypothetical protein